MVQVVADADERESLVEKFANTRSAEKEKSQDDIVLSCGVDERGGSGVELRRSVHVREFIFFVKSHGHTKIVLAEEENVHTGTRRKTSRGWDSCLRKSRRRNVC